ARMEGPYSSRRLRVIQKAANSCNSPLLRRANCGASTSVGGALTGPVSLWTSRTVTGHDDRMMMTEPRMHRVLNCALALDLSYGTQGTCCYYVQSRMV